MATRTKREGAVYPRDDGSLQKREGGMVVAVDSYKVYLKVNVTLSTGTTIDLNNYNSEPFILHCTWMRRTLNRGLGTATIIIDNHEGFWNNVITGGETIKIYADYTDASTQQFVGKIDAVYKNLDGQFGHNIRLECREWPQIQDKLICATFDNIAGDLAIKNIVSEWFSTLLTTTNVGSISTLFYRDYTWTEGIKVFRDIMNKSLQVGYIDFTGDIHTFEESKNDDEMVSIETNVASVDDYGADLQKRRNSIIMTGDRIESSEDLYFLWSKKDTDDIDSFWQKDLLKSESAIDSQDKVENYTGLVYSDENRDFIEGSLNIVNGLPTLKPGESIYCSVPYCDIDGWYQIHEFEHTISPTTNWMTRIYYTKKLSPDERLFDSQDDAIQGNRIASRNPYGMTSATVYEFDENPSLIATFSDTEEYDSYLRLTSGSSTGNALTVVKTFDDDITYAEMRVYGEDLGSSYYQVSFDNGDTFETITLNTKHQVTTSSSVKNKVKVKFFLVKDSDNVTPKLFTAWLGVRFD